MNLGPPLGASHPGLLLPANQLAAPAPWLYPQPLAPAAAPLAAAAGAAGPAPAAAHSQPNKELSERDARLLKRKQANRDSARRSKLKKKQETEELMIKRTQLSDLHNDLIKRVREAQAQVRQLQEANSGLKQRYSTLLHEADGSSGGSHGS